MSNLRDGAGALICIPTYNEKENVEPIIEAVFSNVPEANILVIDDNSPDGTGEIADRLSAVDSRIHLLHRKNKNGLGRAYLDGFRWALRRNYHYIFEFDADFSHNPEYLPDMIEALERYDVVIGSRRVKGGGVESWSLLRRLISWGGSFYARLILGIPIRDLTGGFNGFRRKVIEAIQPDTIKTNGYGFQIELKYRAYTGGFSVHEFPIIFPDRKYGVSKMSRKIFFEALWNVWKIRFHS